MGKKEHVASSPLEVLQGITEERVQHYTSMSSFHWRMEYYLQGAVLSLTRAGQPVDGGSPGKPVRALSLAPLCRSGSPW
jgi:hypothetical protein